MNPIIEVNHMILAENLKMIQQMTKDHVKIMAIIKSNAYGHGILEIAKALSFKVDCFGVGLLSEAVLLKKEGIIQDVLVLGPSYDFDPFVKYNIIQTIESFQQAEAMFQYVENNLLHTHKKINIHIKVDTGFGRFGFLEEELSVFLERYKTYTDHIRIRGVYSHIATTQGSNNTYVQLQNSRFKHLKEYIESKIDTQDVLFHLANSEIAIDYADLHYDMIRVGNALFGPVNSKVKLPLNRIARIKCPIVSVHERLRNDYIGYGLRYRMKESGKIAIIETGFYEGMGLEKRPIGQAKRYQVSYYMKQMLKSILRRDYVYYQQVKLPIIGMINMQYTIIYISDSNIDVGDYVEYVKAPIYFKENIERRHILEENHGISNKSRS